MTPTTPTHTLNKTIHLLTIALHQLEDTLHELHLNQNGYPTSSTAEGATPTLNDAGKPNGLDRYLNQPDPAAQDLHTLTTAIQRAHTNALELHRITTQWTTPTKRKEVTRGTDCLACTRYVPNTDTDRIRSGLCLSCHRSWARSMKERGEWLLQRRKKLQEQQVGGDTNQPTHPIQDNGTSAIATD
jgi:hypothetical protein